ncbi:unnamed protein product [Effrenium voratum]|nr:unnamed protein product [Effrenium voratum]
MTLRVFPELQPRESLCKRLAQPVLQAHAALRKPDAPEPSTELVSAPVAVLPPLREERKPRVPRLATRREHYQAASTSESWQLAKVDGRPRPRPISPSTLREAAYTKETLGCGIYRLGISEEIAERDAEIAAFALHRMDCQRMAGCRERQKAARWRRRKEEKEPLYQVRWLLLPHVEQRPPTPFAEEEPPEPTEPMEVDPDLPPSRPPTPEGWSRSLEKEPTSEGSGKRTPLGDRVMKRLVTRSHNLGEERNWRLTLMRKRTQREKARKVGTVHAIPDSDEVNVAEILFNIKPKEVQAYQAMLRQICRGDSKIDQADLQAVLGEMGFRPRTTPERAVVRQLLSEVDSLEVDFDFLVQRIIPQLRVQLAELRRPGLMQLWTEAEDRSGVLSVEELLAVMQRSGFFPGTQEVVDAVLEVVPGARNFENMEGKLLLDRISVTLPNFRILAPLIQERAECRQRRMGLEIAEELGLDEDARYLWQDNLVDLREAFEQHSEEQLLEASRLPLVFRDTELLPKRRPMQQMLRLMVEARSNGAIELNASA